MSRNILSPDVLRVVTYFTTLSDTCTVRLVCTAWRDAVDDMCVAEPISMDVFDCAASGVAHVTTRSTFWGVELRVSGLSALGNVRNSFVFRELIGLRLPFDVGAVAFSMEDANNVGKLHIGIVDVVQSLCASCCEAVAPDCLDMCCAGTRLSVYMDHFGCEDLTAASFVLRLFCPSGWAHDYAERCCEEGMASPYAHSHRPGCRHDDPKCNSCPSTCFCTVDCDECETLVDDTRLPACRRCHAVDGPLGCHNTACDQGGYCHVSCTACPDLPNADRSSLRCTGGHPMRGPDGCNTAACQGRTVCHITCMNCPGIRRSSRLECCQGRHRVYSSNGCNSPQCLSLPYCHGTCTGCPDLHL